MDQVVKQKTFDFYKNKKVLITGHTGFKGSWLSLWLQNLGAKVCGMALKPDQDDALFNKLDLANQILEHHIQDLRDYQAVEKIVTEFAPDVIFHLAAQPLVRLSYDQPLETYTSNVVGSLHVLEASRKLKSLQSLVFITTDKVYKNKEWLWGYKETDELGGHDPYSSSKACTEILFSSYADSFFKTQNEFGFASARAGNVIGGGDFAKDRIVPDCIRALLKNENLTLRNPKSTRPWQHVLEPLFGYMTLGYQLSQGKKDLNGAYNFGPQKESIRPVDEVVHGIYKNFDSPLKSDVQKASLHEANLLHLNCEKAYQVLNWNAVWNFEQTVLKTSEWYKNVYVQKNDATAITQKQITEFMEAIK